MTDIDTRNQCGACDHPQESHGTRYAAGYGDHEWMPDFTSPLFDGIRTRHTTPTAVPHPEGGVTLAWIEDTDPDPVPGGGDRLPNSTYRKATT